VDEGTARLLLEGRPGIGRTTVARRLVALLLEGGVPVDGFTTGELRTSGRREGRRGALPLGHPAPVGTVTGTTTRAGRRLWFVSNWAWEPVTVPTPVAGVALLSGRGVREGGSVELDAWDVEIAAEA
jgi:NTPase